MPTLDLRLVKKRAVKGVAVLTSRMLVLQGIASVGFFLLTVFLGQAEIGVFLAISEIVAILGYFSDVGLAAALIQKKDEPETRDIRTTFTVQQLLVLALTLLVAGATPWLKAYYRIDQAGVYLLWAFLAAFVMASLKTIPSVCLERQLRFDLLAAVEIGESLVFYLVAVLLAKNNFGLISYAWAVLARGAAGLFLIYRFSPWSVGLNFNFLELKSLLRFGLPYQANSFLAVVKDRLMNVLLWRLIGAQGVGILGWGQKWSQMPLRLVMDAVMKVSFPAYSRMQDDKKELRGAIEKTLFLLAFLVFPMLTMM